jgi:hypothetical protein
METLCLAIQTQIILFGRLLENSIAISRPMPLACQKYESDVMAAVRDKSLQELNLPSVRKPTNLRIICKSLQPMSQIRQKEAWRHYISRAF